MCDDYSVFNVLTKRERGVYCVSGWLCARCQSEVALDI